jgi:hypothetical protein
MDREGVSGAPGETRTPDPLLRRQTLYPTELRAHGWELTKFKTNAKPIATGIARRHRPLFLLNWPTKADLMVMGAKASANLAGNVPHTKSYEWSAERGALY